MYAMQPQGFAQPSYAAPRANIFAGTSAVAPAFNPYGAAPASAVYYGQQSTAGCQPPAAQQYQQYQQPAAQRPAIVKPAFGFGTTTAAPAVCNRMELYAPAAAPALFNTAERPAFNSNFGAPTGYPSAFAAPAFTSGVPSGVPAATVAQAMPQVRCQVIKKAKSSPSPARVRTTLDRHVSARNRASGQARRKALLARRRGVEEPVATSSHEQPAAATSSHEQPAAAEGVSTSEIPDVDPEQMLSVSEVGEKEIDNAIGGDTAVGRCLKVIAKMAEVNDGLTQQVKDLQQAQQQDRQALSLSLVRNEAQKQDVELLERLLGRMSD